jgi:hypothetical protein
MDREVVLMNFAAFCVGWAPVREFLGKAALYEIGLDHNCDALWILRKAIVKIH